jgi:hypothetical protein
MASPCPQRVWFDRRLIYIGERCCIESVCVLCGAHIISSVAETLMQDEAEHIAECPGVERSA